MILLKIIAREQQGLSHSLEGRLVQLLWKSVAVSYKTKHTFTTLIRIQTPWYLLKGVENMSIQKPDHKRL